MDHDELLRELQNIVEHLNSCIGVIIISADACGCTPYEIRSTDGSYFLHPLMTAKANAMAAIVQLTVAKVNETCGEPAKTVCNDGPDDFGYYCTLTYGHKGKHVYAFPKMCLWVSGPFCTLPKGHEERHNNF